MSRIKTKIITPVAKKRVRRTTDQLIADLEAKIEHIKVRAVTRAAKKNPAIKFTNQAVRAIDLALADAANGAHKEALTEARTVLVAYLQLEGLKIPQRRGPRGRRRAGADESEPSLESGTG